MHAWHDVELGDHVEDHDGDPLDVLVLGQEPVLPLCILRARAIGVLTIRDDKGQDDKIIAIHLEDPEHEHYHDIAELPPHRLRELERFFLDYKVLEHKTVDVQHLRGRVEAGTSSTTPCVSTGSVSVQRGPA